MRFKTVGFIALGLACLSGNARGQAGTQFQVTKITKTLISAPGMAFTGAQQYPQNLRDKWLEVEVEFAAVPEFTDDLTVKYFILMGDKVLTGEVNLVNVPAGRQNRTVIYVPPKVLLRFNGNRAVTAAAVGNIAVQLVQQGSIKDELSVTRAPAQWYSTLPAVGGLLLNKNDSPFAPLYWDRYEQIKPPAAR